MSWILTPLFWKVKRSMCTSNWPTTLPSIALWFSQKLLVLCFEGFIEALCWTEILWWTHSQSPLSVCISNTLNSQYFIILELTTYLPILSIFYWCIGKKFVAKGLAEIKLPLDPSWLEICFFLILWHTRNMWHCRHFSS